MSRVIKDNNGVAVVEGTPAASLVKDVDRFFASKPPERMAGESISQPRKIDKNKIMSEAEYNSQKTKEINEAMKRGLAISPEPYSDYLERQQPGYEEKRAAAIQRERELIERNNSSETSLDRSPRVRDVDSQRDRKPFKRHGRPAGGNPNRNKAKERAESRRERFFQRRRSRKEAVRSQREQEATQGKFITTLGR